MTLNTNMDTKLILASTSVFRKELLERLAIPFISIAPLFDEETLKNQSLKSCELTELLALKKAESLKDHYPKAVIIGSDQVVSFNGLILGKPKTKEKALETLSLLSGKTHEIITSMAVISSQMPPQIHTNVTKMTMRSLTQEELKRYIEKDQPLQCAGSYKIEKVGISLFEKIESADSTAIIGLPLMALTGILRALNFNLP